MTMNDNERLTLEQEAARGARYKGAWHDLVEPFFDNRSEALFEMFKATPSTDTVGLVNIRMQHNVLEGLKQEFESYITTGRMATQTLNEEEDKNGK